jgi:hypothetical protein
MTDTTRLVEIRKQPNVNFMRMQLPYVYIQPQFGYSMSDIQRKINNQTMLYIGAWPDTFPKTITSHYWTYKTPESLNPSVPGLFTWASLGTLADGHYFFYTAQCKNVPETFLQSDSSMNLWVSTRYSDLIHFAMNQNLYDQYIKDCEPIKV